VKEEGNAQNGENTVRMQ